MYNNPSVLLDDIDDASGGNYSATVTLPNVECDNCTLQVIQVMYDKPPYTIPGNEMYYQCADLVLAGPIELDAGSPGEADSGVALPDAGGASDAAMLADGGGGSSEAASCACIQATRSHGLLALAPVLFLLANLRRQRPRFTRA